MTHKQEHRRSFIVITSLLLAGVSVVPDPVFAGTNQPPSAQQLLDSVVAQMPNQPVLIVGRLGVRDRAQRTLRAYNVDIRLHINGKSVSGCYTLFDALGATLEQFKMEREPGKQPRYEYEKGDPLQSSPLPGLFDVIRDTGVSWSDLTFPFLWWRDGSVAGEDSYKGRDCFIVELCPPQSEVKQPMKLRVWIDQKYRMFLKAEEYDAAGKMLRRLSVVSFKKINEEWMVKDIAVEGSPNLPSGYKSVLVIRDMHAVGGTAGANPATDTPTRILD